MNLQLLLRRVNWRGEMVANVFCFAANAAIRLVSSLVLTRLLFPEAYGIVAMIGAVSFIVELVSDIGIVAFLIRHKQAAEATVLHTVWTIRLVRAILNTSIMYVLAPLIAHWYETPLLESALRIYSITFILKAMESMSFLLALRNQNSRMVNFMEVWGTLISVIFTIIYSYFSRDHYGMLYGMLINRFVVTLISYIRDDRIIPKLHWHKKIAAELFGFAKYVGPSSILTIFISQFDRILMLKLFDLKMLGLYGVAGGVASPVSQLISQVNHNIFYPRCAEYLRGNVNLILPRYYKENSNIFYLTIALPCIVGGFSHLIINTLFDSRYAAAANVVQAFCISALLSAFALPSENILVASGRLKEVLFGNIIRIAWLLLTSYAGYTVWGFEGFIYSVALNSLPVIPYFWYRRNTAGLIYFRKEGFLIAYAGVAWLSCWGLSSLAIAGISYFHGLR